MCTVAQPSSAYSQLAGSEDMTSLAVDAIRGVLKAFQV